MDRVADVDTLLDKVIDSEIDAELLSLIDGDGVTLDDSDTDDVELSLIDDVFEIDDVAEILEDCDSLIDTVIDELFVTEGVFVFEAEAGTTDVDADAEGGTTELDGDTEAELDAEGITTADDEADTEGTRPEVFDAVVEGGTTELVVGVSPVNTKKS